MKRITISLMFPIFFLLACSHAPVSTVEEPTPEQFKQEIQRTLVDKIDTVKDFKGVRKVEITSFGDDKSEKGAKSFKYRVEFQTDDPDAGIVTHIFAATGRLTRVSDTQWNIETIKPGTQELIFQKPTVVAVKRK